ncbi:hypothetical protein GF337_11475, partial [candidate division KSB1 bacterium]|nr:hypothetical protein [candidate division KSB1 bacterium]
NFAEMVYPAIESPWTNLFDSAKERDVWQYMKTVLDVRDAQLNMRMVTGDRIVPVASAYTIGYRIVRAFLEQNPDTGVLEWTDMAPGELLERSGYGKSFGNEF